MKEALLRGDFGSLAQAVEPEWKCSRKNNGGFRKIYVEEGQNKAEVEILGIGIGSLFFMWDYN